MKKYTIDSFNDLDNLAEENQANDTQVIFSITGNVDSCHFLSKLENQLIVVTNEQEKEVKCLIELEPRPISTDPNWEFNTSSFSFGNKKFQKMIFSNITFFHQICDYSDIVTIDIENIYDGKFIERIKSNDSRLSGCQEILFIEASGNASLTFFNCTFQNNTNKKFKLVSRNNSFLSFVNCRFQGDFIFENLEKSIIVNN